MGLGDGKRFAWSVCRGSKGSCQLYRQLARRTRPRSTRGLHGGGTRARDRRLDVEQATADGTSDVLKLGKPVHLAPVFLYYGYGKLPLVARVTRSQQIR